MHITNNPDEHLMFNGCKFVSVPLTRDLNTGAKQEQDSRTTQTIGSFFEYSTVSGSEILVSCLHLCLCILVFQNQKKPHNVKRMSGHKVKHNEKFVGTRINVLHRTLMELPCLYAI